MASVAARLARLKAQRSAAPPAASSPAWPDVPAATPAPAEDWLARPLRGHPVAVIDTETTGVDPATARIVEVAVVLIDALAESEPRVVLSTRVNPGEPIPEAATRVHGISDADVAGAPSWADLWPDFHRAVDGHILAAYNAPYDYQVIRAESERAGPRRVGGVVWRPDLPGRSGAPRWLDPLVLVRLVDQYEAGKQLRQMAARRGVTVEAHGAAGDAMTVAMLLPTLLGEAPRLLRHGRAVEGRPLGRDLQTVGAYLAWQRATALAQERDLVAFLAKAGRRDPVTCQWHALEGLPPPEAPRPAVKTTPCKSCGAPVLWAVTSSGSRIPLDPTEIRASADGPGRAVSLVVEGGAVVSLREDPAGDQVGRESHFATCPNAAQHRKPTPAPAPSTDVAELVESFRQSERAGTLLDAPQRCRCGAPVIRMVEVGRGGRDLMVDAHPVHAVPDPYMFLGAEPVTAGGDALGHSGPTIVEHAGAWWERMPSHTRPRIEGAIEVATGTARPLFAAKREDEPGAVAVWQPHRCRRST